MRNIEVLHYMRRVARAIEYPEIFSEGFVQTFVCHDDECIIWVLGGELCTCVPEITLKTAHGCYEVDRTGRPHRLHEA